MDRIKSFTINHDVLVPGFYISREDGDVITYDLRTRKPNAGDGLMAAEAMDEALEGYPNASLSDSAQNMHQTKRMKDIFDSDGMGTDKAGAGGRVCADGF